MGDIPDSDCPFYEALTPGQWVHSRNQIKHESMLLTVQKSRMKERKNKGTKEGSKERKHLMITDFPGNIHSTFVPTQYQLYIGIV